MDSKIKLLLAFILSILLLGLVFGIFSFYKYMTPKSDEFFKNIEKSAKFQSDNILKSNLDNALDSFYTVANKDKNKNKLDRENFKISNTYFKNLLKNSTTSCDDKCFGKEYSNLENEKIPNIYNKNFVSLKIKNVSYIFNIENSACMTGTSTTSHLCGFGYIDINSEKEPNKLGYDLFNVGLFADEKGTFFIAPANIDEVAKTRCTLEKGYDCIFFALNKDLSYMNTPNASKSSLTIKEKPYLDIYKIPNKNEYVFYNYSGFKGKVTPLAFFKNLSKFIKYKLLSL